MEIAVFNGIHTLDSIDIRMGCARIPEVAIRLREAQEIWDRNRLGDFDFSTFLISEDNYFLQGLTFKSLLAAIVQVGLYDRYLKTHKEPELLLGCVNGDSPMKVASREQSFEEMILTSKAAFNQRLEMLQQQKRELENTEGVTDPGLLALRENWLEKNKEALAKFAAEAAKKKLLETSGTQLAGGVQLAGFSLTEYGVTRRTAAEGKDSKSDSYHRLNYDGMDVEKLAKQVIEDLGPKQMVHIGPGNMLLQKVQQEYALHDIQFSESISIDPMLSWFWSKSPQLLAFAQ